MENKIHQLVYISAAEHAFTEAELQELLSKARENNTSLDVSGMLLFHEGSFIQALEGDKDKVNSLYNKIAKDERHSETRVLYKGDQEDRDFDTWSMGFYRSNQSTSENLDGFHQFLRSGFKNDPRVDESRARKALLQFRDGSWRHSVDS